MAKFVVYRDASHQYRWRLIASNGEIVAVGEAHTTKYGAIRSAERVKQIAYWANIVDATA